MIRSTKIFLAFVLIVLQFQIRAQTHRVYSNESNYASPSFGLVKGIGNKYILGGTHVDTVNGQIQWRITFFGTDSIGNIEWKKYYGSSKFKYNVSYLAERAMSSSNNFLYFASNLVDSNQSNSGVIMKLNLLGDSLWQKRYYDVNGNDLWFYSIREVHNKDILVAGVTVKNYTTSTGATTLSAFVMLTDSLGNEKWRKVIPPNQYHFRNAYDAIEDPATKNIIVVGDVQGGPIAQYGTVYLFDGLGNLMNNFGENDYRYGSALVKVEFTKNGDLIASSGQVDPIPNSNGVYLQQAGIVRMDVHGKVKWKFLYDTLQQANGYMHIKETSNGDILASGVYDQFGKHFANAWDENLVVTRIDSTGRWKWRRYYNMCVPLGSLERMKGLEIAANGDMVFSYLRSITCSERMTFVRTTTNGWCDNLAAYCDTNSVIEGVAEWHTVQATLFPNPTSNLLTIQWEGSVPLNVQLFDVSGSLLHTQSISNTANLSMSAYASGIYLVQLSAPGYLPKRVKVVRE
jgi:hypothetical protein